jgi:hypothetical protein
MVQKHILIAMIAPVAVAGILMLAILAATTGLAFAQEKPTELTLNVSPTTVLSGSTAPISVTGKLTSGGSGVGGATITFTGFGAKAVTGPDGNFSTTTSASGMEKTTNIAGMEIAANITAHYAGDTTHMSSNSAAKTITFCYQKSKCPGAK